MVVCACVCVCVCVSLFLVAGVVVLLLLLLLLSSSIHIALVVDNELLFLHALIIADACSIPYSKASRSDKV